MERARRKIVIVGCGPGSPEYVTPVAQKAIEGAEVLVGSCRLLDLFPRTGAERITIDRDIEKVLREIAQRLDTRRIAVVVSGDPGLCSLSQPIIRHFGRDLCEVIPGVSSIQAAFARLGLEWLDARMINAHSRDPEVDPASLKDAGKIAIFMGRKESLLWVKNLAESLGGAHSVFVCENLTLEDETVRRVKLADLESLDVNSKTIVLLVRKDELP
jgi:precorrin-6y C5,15-methyltransferase (decarboxylating) CbiE subunit